MAVIKWSDEQLKAINFSTSQGGSAIVSAAAGSGKTAMLVERITRLLASENPQIPAYEIVAVTFTNDAAAELKSRLETAISELLKTSQTPWLREQLINLESAHICTISSFCVALLREFAQESELRPDFKICEGKEAERFSQQALEHALNSIYDGVFFTSDEKIILRGLTGEAGDSKLGSAVLRLYTEYVKQPFPEQWLAEKTALYLDKSNFDSLVASEKQRPETGKKEITITAGLLADFDFIVEKQAPQVQLLSRLFGIYRDKYNALKAEANCVDFADAEHFVLRLLKDESLAEQVRSGFYEIIVDEFQDSNAVQYEIFRRLSNGRNLFFVGDVKQSIYRFRNADQRVFSRVAESSDYTTLTLNKNYRSSREVIGAVNEIFNRNMTHEVGGVSYDDSAKLIFGLQTSERTENQAELVIVENAADAKAAEADYIAGRIAEMVADGFKIADKHGVLRACGYGDFAVLVSGLSAVEEEFGAALEARGIPFDKQKSGDYSEVPEIKTILNLLTVIEKPFDDMALLTVLMSPLYGFTAADIAEARVKGVNKPLFDNLGDCAFTGDHRRWSAYSKNCGASKLIRLIYDEGGFNPLVAASFNPAKTMTNIRLLMYYSENLKSLTKDSLWGFVEALGGESTAALEEAKSSVQAESSRVKLMTIHASKGLEFPICFVARTNSRFNLRENYSDIIFSGEIGFAMRHIVTETRTRVDTLLHRKVREENQAAAVSEEMRKLYVACTRARDKLILTAALKENKKPEKNSYLNWLLQTDINAIYAEGDTPVVPPDENSRTEPSDSTDETAAIIAATKRVYAREPLTKIPRRVTATQITGGLPSSPTDEKQDEPTVFPRGASFMKNKKLTGKKRGDAYHKMMELLDFKKADFTAQMNICKCRFTEEEFNAIEPEKIAAFFSSPLGIRACASVKVCKEFKLCTEINLSELGCPAEYDELFEDEKPFVQGIADMYFYEGENIILTDYKTNRGMTAEKLIRQYRTQLEIYARAIEEMTGSKVTEKWIYSFELGAVQVF